MNRKNFLKSALVGLGILSFSFTLKGSSPQTIKSKQKFFRGQRVKFKNSDGGISEGIVQCSFREESNCSLTEMKYYPMLYTLLVWNTDPPFTYSLPYFFENDLILIDADRDKGEQIIQNYLDGLERFVK